MTNEQIDEEKLDEAVRFLMFLQPLKRGLYFYKYRKHANFSCGDFPTSRRNNTVLKIGTTGDDIFSLGNEDDYVEECS